MDTTIPAHYLASRQTFRRLAQGLGAATSSISMPAQASGENDLTVDTALLGRPDAPTLIVIASGTHGVEGYGGAACQFHFMRSWPGQYRHRADVAFLLVHAVNPWGYFHDRRVTQEGVDLNRNFIDDFSHAALGSGYDAFHAMLVTNYRPLPAGLWNELRFLRHGLGRKSRSAVRTAVTAGQYTHPDGLFYGGAAPTASRLAWETIIRAQADGRACAVLLDLHTGLGKRGAAELISYLPDSSRDFRTVSAWFGGDLRSMQTGASVAAPLAGTLTEGFDRLVPGQSYAIGLEFGTIPALRVLNAMRYDHWVRLHSETLPATFRERARKRMKHAFCVESAAWHAQVTAQFERTIQRLLDGLAQEIELTAGRTTPVINRASPPA